MILEKLSTKSAQHLRNDMIIVPSTIIMLMVGSEIYNSNRPGSLDLRAIDAFSFISQYGNPP